MKKSIGAKTLAYPTPVWCIGSYDNNHQPNVMTIAWGGICCSNPVCVTISIREATHTYKNITERGAYTVNIPSTKYAAEADYFGMVSGKNINKFETTGLTPVSSEIVDAPYIKEFPLVLECQILHAFEIGVHTQFIGEIIDVKADESILNDTDLPDIEKVKPIIFSPVNRLYHKVGKKIGNAFDMGKSFK